MTTLGQIFFKNRTFNQPISLLKDPITISLARGKKYDRLWSRLFLIVLAKIPLKMIKRSENGEL